MTYLDEKNNGFTYSGLDELVVMDNMVKYNKSIIKKMIQSSPDLTTTLDFGAGIGTLAKLAQPYAKELTCLEIDENERLILKSKAFNVAKNLEEIKDNSQTFIYTCNVLEHIEDDEQTLNKLYGKLKPDGKIFIYVPAFNFLFSSMDKKVGHYRRYEKKRLKCKLTAAKFAIEKTYYTDFIGVLLTLLYKCRGNNHNHINQKHLKIYDRFIFPLNKLVEWATKHIIGKNLVVIAKKSNHQPGLIE
jgi:ubiquinone/menaquinone biosynthesis C-methylase UbiE